LTCTGKDNFMMTNDPYRAPEVPRDPTRDARRRDRFDEETRATIWLPIAIAIALFIGLGYYFFEQLIVALFSSLFTWFQNVADFFLVRNISAWTGASGGFPGAGTLPDATQAIIVLGLYTLILGGVAFWLFERRDVQGATGGG